MDPILQKIVYASIGAFTITKEKVEELVDELIKRGEVSQEEKSKVIKETMAKIEERSKQAKVWIEDSVNKAAEKMKPKFQKDIEEMQNKINALEKQVASFKRDINQLKKK